MNNSKFPGHPWRSRTNQFASHLATLRPEERRQVEDAERRFLSRRSEPSSPHLSAARDFAASMVGPCEVFDTEQF